MSVMQGQEEVGLWDLVGNIEEGRINLGADMPVAAYRLFEFSMRETLYEMFGKDVTVQILRTAGRKAGIEFAKNLLDTSLDFNLFIADFQQQLIDMKMGILRIEQIEKEREITLTISEDLDCSGLPITGETVCNYDEGFIQGILEEYDHKEYSVIEIDCWAKGDRVCRFKVSENNRK